MDQIGNGVMVFFQVIGAFATYLALIMLGWYLWEEHKSRVRAKRELLRQVDRLERQSEENRIITSGINSRANDWANDWANDILENTRDLAEIAGRVEIQATVLEMARQVMEIMAKKILDQQAQIDELKLLGLADRVDSLEAEMGLVGNDILSLKRAQGEDSLALHELDRKQGSTDAWMRITDKELSGDGGIYDRLAKLEAKRTRKAA